MSDKLEKLTDEELLFIEMFFEQSINIIGTTLKVPLRFSHEVGDLTMYLSIEKNKNKR